MFKRTKKYIQNKYISPILKLISEGGIPKDISLAITGALLIGIFPVIGGTTILCAIFAFRYRLNVPLTQLINITMVPVQLVMIIPFMKAGEIFGYGKLNFTLQQITDMIMKTPLNAISVLWNVTMQAIIIWLIFSLLTGYFIFIFLNKTIVGMIPNDQTIE